MAMESWVLIGGIAVVPFVAAIVRLMSVTWPGVNWTRWRPMACVVVGVILGVVAGPIAVGTINDLRDSLLLGLGAGLSASGLYGVTDTVRDAVQDRGGSRE